MRADLYVTYDGGQKREILPSTLTFAFGRVDERGQERIRKWLDFHDDADRAFDDRLFEERFLAFRAELPPA